ncbi:MAG: efflux RND transporter permease subunit, partial [Nannocystaceae bacterium]
MHTILVANRGEIACRVIRTARAQGYRTVAVYSDADSGAPHVALADLAVHIGPSPASQSYLDADKILAAAKRTGADAIHPGYGFLSEQAAFAQACQDAGITFIGPPAPAIALMGNKSAAKRKMLDAGVPCVPGFHATEGSPDDATLVAEATRIGFPLLVKAAAGGGGRGMRLVHRAEDLPAAITSARSEAANAFGSDQLLLERAIIDARHIEIQIFGDTHGHTIHLGERDCSVQRRHQKVIEEAPSPAVDQALRARMGAAAVDAASAIGERLTLLTSNGVQGLLLVFLTLWLFFNTRLALWVAAGLPVSFLGGLWVMSLIGYTLNMMTMMALLLALGLLMDDGIVLADNVAAHLRRGKGSVQAAVDGVKEVAPGVFASFMTTICVFGPLTMLDGQIGRVLLVIPVVLIAVMAVSLVEAFWILPNHLGHSLHGYNINNRSSFRKRFDAWFEGLRERWVGRAADFSVRHRYATLGTALGVFVLSLGLLAGGVLKFEGFPATDGDLVEFRLRMPAGTPLRTTEAEIERVVRALDRVNDKLSPEQPEGEKLVRNVTVRHNYNPDSPDVGPHIATVQVDLLSVEVRTTSINDFNRAWRDEAGPLSDATTARFTSQGVGPGGAAIELRVQGDALDDLADAGQEIRQWMGAFDGVFDLSLDLEAGTPQVRVRMRPGALGTSAQGKVVANQLRA